MSDDKPNLDSLFLAASEIGSAAERAAFLADACDDNDDLRQQVEQLLQSDQHASGFMEQSAPGLEETIVPDASGNNLAASLDAGLASAFGEDAAVVIGDANHNVLRSLSKTLSEIPNVSLRVSDAEGDDPITRPTSPEMPKSDSDSRYQLQGEIARGGMGAILKGRDTDLGRDLAIKVLLDAHKDKPEVIQRFVEEAQIGGQLQHPGIAPIYELGQFSDKRPFFAMKLVKGQTLSKLLADRDDAADERGKFIGIFEQVCQTMAYAHSRGVIHRDLKPANIMVGAFGEVQVMDWGLAKVLQVGGVADEKKSQVMQKDQSIIQTMRSVGSDVPGLFGSTGSDTQMGSVMGTPAYMPPEQALGEIDQMDERADVFGLGAILCEILTGKPPYVGTDGTAVYRQASRGRLDACMTRLDDCGADEDLASLTKHCLQLEPKERPRDAGVLAERVSDYLESVENKLRETEMAKADAQIRAEELRHRQKLAFRAGAAVVATLVIGISVSAWQTVRATNAERLATIEAVRATSAEQAARDEAERATTAEQLAKEEAIRATTAEKETARTLVQVSAERDAKEQARKDAEAIAKFLSDILQSPDPGRDGRAVTVAELLDKAAQQLETSLAAQPEQLARMQAVLARTYYSLGLYREAIPLQEKAREYFLATLGPEDVLALDAGSILAGLYGEVGRLDEAYKLREEDLAIRRRVFGSEHLHTLRAMQGMSISYSDAGKTQGALELREEMLTGLRKLLGPDDPQTLVAMEQVASSYDAAGRLQETLAMREQAMAGYRATLPPGHPTLLWGMYLLSRSYHSVGRFDEALNLREETLALRSESLGPEHPQTVDSMSVLADSYHGVGRKDEAIKLREEVLALRRKSLGLENRQTLWAMGFLAGSYREAGRLDEDLKLLEEMRSINLKAHGAFNPDILWLNATIAGKYLDDGRTAEAIPLLQELLTLNPADTLSMMMLAALQVWFDMETEYAATCHRMLHWVETDSKTVYRERVVKLVSLRPTTDATILEKSLAFARDDVERGKDSPSLPWFQMALGMAEYRNGNYGAAIPPLSAAIDGVSLVSYNHYQRQLEGTAGFYRVMCLFREGKLKEAREHFADAEAKMKPLPVDDRNPLVNGANLNDLILWLAYKEAKLLLRPPE